MQLTNIRNFCIIAHIDHGKSTLADRMMQNANIIDDRKFRDQLLDDMDLERERGITIKSHPVTMNYTAKDGKEYEFNLIDTPGHVDFSYEVSRSMAACEGALLVVDAAQGVEAQTVANVYMAMEHDLEIIPVINKIDLPSADVEEVCRQIEDILAINTDDALLISSKTGIGIDTVMEAVAERLPPPKPEKFPEYTRALVFDSVYDAFRGVVTYIRVMDGKLEPHQRVRFMGSDAETLVKEVGIFAPEPKATKSLQAGQVGYIIGTLKNPSDIIVGDTVTISGKSEVTPLEGFKEVHSMVFCGLYPVNADDYEKFRQSMDKLKLNDASFNYHPDSSVALGFGFRCGFLGLLHMEIIQERLLREYDMDIISTQPSVVYRIHMRDGTVTDIDNPTHLPDQTLIDKIEEPLIKATIICKNDNIGEVMKLVMDRRGEVTKTESMDATRVMLTAIIPLNEILTDFHDNLKSISRGYASMDYEYEGYQVSDIVKMDILLNGEPVDAFSTLVHSTKAVHRGRQICKALKDAIPPHQFNVPIQATLNSKVIARETIRQFRKDVTAKLYGGDVSRKRKLLDKQKKGKKRMKQFGKVTVPQKAFVSVLKS